MSKLPPRLLFVIVLALFAFAASCSALKKGVYTGSGAALGAAGGSLLGPVGAIAGAAVGGVAGHALNENQELRDGQLTGEGAHAREHQRTLELLAQWRGEALNSREIIAEQSEKIDWYGRAKVWGAIALGLLFAWRNREHIFKRGPGYLRRFAHALLGPKPKLLRTRT
jgi:hypothetical protein